MNDIDQDIDLLRRLAKAEPEGKDADCLAASLTLSAQHSYPLKHLTPLARLLSRRQQLSMLRELTQAMPAKRLQDPWGFLARLAEAQLSGGLDDSLRAQVFGLIQANPPIRPDNYVRECIEFGFTDTDLLRNVVFALSLASGAGIGEIIAPDCRKQSPALEYIYWDAILRTAARAELQAVKPELEKYLRSLKSRDTRQAELLTERAAQLYREHCDDHSFELLVLDRLLAQGGYKEALAGLTRLQRLKPPPAGIGERIARTRLGLGEPFAALIPLIQDLMAESRQYGSRPLIRDLLVRSLLGIAEQIAEKDPPIDSSPLEAIKAAFPDSDRPLRHELQVLKSYARHAEALPIAREMLRRAPADPGALREYGMILRLCNRPLVERLLARRRRQYAKGLIPPLALVQALYAFERQMELTDLCRHRADLRSQPEIERLFQLSLFQSGDTRELARLREQAGSRWYLGAVGIETVAAFCRLREKLGLDQGADTLALAVAVATRFADTPAQYQPVSGRVLVVAHSLGIGGCERQIQYLIDHAPTHHHAFHILVKQRRTRDFALGDADIRFFDELPEAESAALAEAGIGAADIARVFRSEGLGRLVAAILDFRPQTVHFTVGNVVEAVLASLVCGVPRTLIQFGSMHLSRLANGAQSGQANIAAIDAFGRALNGHPRFVFAVNANAAVADWSERWGLPGQSLTLISNAFTTELLGRGKLSAEHARLLARIDELRAGGARVVGSVFRMDEVKDPWFWFAVARDVVVRDPDAIVVHCGDGPARTRIQKQIRRLGLKERIFLVGIVTDGLHEFYRRFDAFLLTSHTECLPNVILEAQISGVPVVAPLTGGISEGVIAEFARLLPDKDVGAYSAALRDWLAVAETTKPRLAAASQILMDRYLPDQMIAQTLQCYAD